MSEERIPLGKREDLRLEFKAAEILRTPEKIGREIVGMLNAGGGELWIGLEESDGRAVRVGGVPDSARAKDRLRDHLLETIEPAPRDELDLEVVPYGDGGEQLLRIRVRPGKRGRGRYCYRSRDGRYFGIRVADRLRTMSWHEIFEAENRADRADGWRKAEQAVQRQLKDAIESRRAVLWLCLKPVEEMGLELRSLPDEIFTDPAATGNRRSGWNFVDPRMRPKKRSDKVLHGEPDGRMTEVHRDGLILFTVPVASLYWKGEPDLIWPYVLIEYPVSIFRLAAHLYREVQARDDERIAAKMALLSAQGCKLKAGSVRSVRWQFEDAKAFETPLVETSLFEQDRNDLIANPAGNAYPLIMEIYQQCGFDEEDLPAEFDRQRGFVPPV